MLFLELNTQIYVFYILDVTYLFWEHATHNIGKKKKLFKKNIYIMTHRLE